MYQPSLGVCTDRMITWEPILSKEGLQVTCEVPSSGYHVQYDKGT